MSNKHKLVSLEPPRGESTTLFVGLIILSTTCSNFYWSSQMFIVEVATLRQWKCETEICASSDPLRWIDPGTTCTRTWQPPCQCSHSGYPVLKHKTWKNIKICSVYLPRYIRDSITHDVKIYLRNIHSWL